MPSSTAHACLLPQKNYTTTVFLLKTQGGPRAKSSVHCCVRACGDQGQLYDASSTGRARRPDTYFCTPFTALLCVHIIIYLCPFDCQSTAMASSTVHACLLHTTTVFFTKNTGREGRGQSRQSVVACVCGDQGQLYEASSTGRARRPDTDPYPKPSVQLPSHDCGSQIGAVHGWMEMDSWIDR